MGKHGLQQRDRSELELNDTCLEKLPLIFLA